MDPIDLLINIAIGFAAGCLVTHYVMTRGRK